MSRFIDLSVTVDENTLSPPSTNMKLEVRPHRRGPGFWQVSSVNQSLHTGAHIDSPLHVFRNGSTTAGSLDASASNPRSTTPPNQRSAASRTRNGTPLT
jgi:kynurenine formamidase